LDDDVTMSRLTQSIRYCTTSGGLRLAYATSGQGPPLVRAAHFLTHIEFDLESPVWAPWLRELSRERTLVRYDGRGCGLSDRTDTALSLDAWVDDLEAVVDAAGLERFALFGCSQGCAVSIAYATRHPKRVSSLVLLGGYVRGVMRRKPDSGAGQGSAPAAGAGRTRLGPGQPGVSPGLHLAVHPGRYPGTGALVQ
jgi:pimeloyl-ACP methyl ester carboxylesterase